MVLEMNLLFALGGVVLGAGLGYWLGSRRGRAQLAESDLNLDLDLN